MRKAAGKSGDWYGHSFPLCGNGYLIRSFYNQISVRMGTVYFSMEFVKLDFFSPTEYTYTNYLDMHKYVKIHLRQS